LEDLESDVDADDDEGAGDGDSKELGDGASDVKAKDKDSDELNADEFASSSIIRGPMQRKLEVAAARANRSTDRALSHIAALDARAAAAAASSREDGMSAQGRPVRTQSLVNYAEDVQSQRWTQ
jgi:hypothetical protein